MNLLPNHKPRIEIVDALRGVAVMAIMLLHNVEHFNFYKFPEAANSFMKSLDTTLWDGLFFVFAGKAFAIFSLLFGFSFFIQYKNQQDRGHNFRGRFLWRLLLLFFIGCFNAMFFPGEILVLYSIIGGVLVLSCRWSNRTVLIVAILLLLQPMEWVKFVQALLNPDAVQEAAQWRVHMQNYYPYLSKPEFFAMVKSNLWDGQLFSILWAYGHGRFYQTAALFLFGMLLGRGERFSNLDKQQKFWRKTLLIGAICFVPLYFFTKSIPDILSVKSAITPLNTIFSSFKNIAFMAAIVAGIVLLWQTARGFKIFKIFVPYGKMSLTNYITQSMIGSFIYFEYGLGLWDDFGITASFATGIVLFVTQLLFCKWWLKHFRYGPFEYLWRQATWVCSKR